jgi:hypothetical protein
LIGARDASEKLGLLQLVMGLRELLKGAVLDALLDGDDLVQPGHGGSSMLFVRLPQ